MKLTSRDVLDEIRDAVTERWPSTPYPDDTACQVVNQARVAINFGFKRWPWYQQAELQIIREYGGFYGLLRDVAIEILMSMEGTRNSEIQAAGMIAMQRVAATLRREYDGSRVPATVSLDLVVDFPETIVLPPKTERLIVQLWSEAEGVERELLAEIACGVSMRSAAENVGLPRSTARHRLERLRVRVEGANEDE